MHIYNIVREAIHNAIRHGNAKNITISLIEKQHFILTITDDGKGYNKHNAEGMGLATMKYRAQTIGGKFSIAPTTEKGTIVTCSFPKEN